MSNMITKDLQATLVLLLEVLPREKAIGALELYHEHDMFRQKLNGFYIDVEQTPVATDLSEFEFDDQINKVSKEVSNSGKVSDGPFKQAFEDIIEEVVTLSKHITEKYNSFKKVVKKSELSIEEHQKTFTNAVTQKEHEIKKLEAEMKDAEGDSRAIESITKASKLLKVEIEDE